MMVKELKNGVLDGRKWFYSESSAMHVDEEKAHLFDDSLVKMEEKQLPIHEEFYILSNSIISE